jgi:hypothetical protein
VRTIQEKGTLESEQDRVRNVQRKEQSKDETISKEKNSPRIRNMQNSNS